MKKSKIVTLLRYTLEMTNDSNQVTVKVHEFVVDYLTEMLEHFEKEGFSFSSELALHDIAVLHLKDRFDEAQKSKVDFKSFVEGLIADAMYLQEEKIVTVKMRGVGTRKK